VESRNRRDLQSEPEKILGPCCQRCLNNTRYVVTDAMPQSIGWVIFTRNARGDLIPTRAGHAEVLETVQSQSEMLAAQRGIVEALEGNIEVCTCCGWRRPRKWGLNHPRANAFKMKSTEQRP
jgi:hypothetical protein